MSIVGKRIGILVDNYFEQAEFEVPLGFLRSEGAIVEVIATTNKDIQGMCHAKMGAAFLADELLETVTPADYDGLLLPGGVINADKLRMVEKAQQWVNEFVDEGKLIAAICHAPWLLVSADAVEARRLTSYYTLQDDIRNAGGEWISQPVVVDKNFITSREPDDLEHFTAAIKEWFEQKDS